MRDRFLDGEESAFHVDVKSLVIETFRCFADGSEFGNARVDEQNVDPTQFFDDRLEELIEIIQFADVRSNGEDATAKQRDGGVECPRVAAGDRYWAPSS